MRRVRFVAHRAVPRADIGPVDAADTADMTAMFIAAHRERTGMAAARLRSHFLTDIGRQVIDAISASYGRPPVLLTVRGT